MKTTEEKTIIVMTKANSMPDVTIPPIDRAAPPQTETATFALG